MSKSDEEDAIIVPLPGDSKTGGKVGTTGPTDENGRFTFKVRNTRIGRYRYHVESQDGKVKSNEVVVQVLPLCKNKGDITRGNDILRASITSETQIQEIERMVQESKLYLDLAPANLKKVALKQYQKTTNHASKRIEQLRLVEKAWGGHLSKDGVSFHKSERKKA